MPIKTKKKPKSTRVMGMTLTMNQYLSVLEKPTAKAMLARLNQLHARQEKETFRETTMTPKRLSRAAKNCDMRRAPKARCGTLFANSRDVYKFLDQVRAAAADGLNASEFPMGDFPATYNPRRTVQTLLNLTKFGVQAEAFLQRLQTDAE